MILEVAEGPEAGRRIVPKEGAVTTVGRTVDAMEVFAGDVRMCPLHFAVGLRAGELYLTNLNKTNGTLVNGKRIESATLKGGDVVTAGVTAFRVFAPPPNPYPAKLRIGGWGFDAIPEGWTILEGAGLILETTEGFQPNAAALEDAMKEAETLAQFVGAQIEFARGALMNPVFEGPVEATIEGAEQALLLIIHSITIDGELVLQRQYYAASGTTIGVLTLSVANSQATAMHSTFAAIVQGASFHTRPIPESTTVDEP
jgi:hypothetical protein